MTAPRISIERIKAVVAAEFRVPRSVMEYPHRDYPRLVPRQVAISLAYQLTPNSNAAVGRVFGGLDSSTVTNARQRIEQLRRSDADLDRRIRRIERALEAGGIGDWQLAPPVQLDFLPGPLFDRAGPFLPRPKGRRQMYGHGPTASEERILDLHEDGRPPDAIAMELGISLGRVARTISELGAPSNRAWEAMVRHGSARLLEAIRRHHPERCQ